MNVMDSVNLQKTILDLIVFLIAYSISNHNITEGHQYSFLQIDILPDWVYINGNTFVDIRD